MKILISGMTSKQTNPDASKRAVTVAWLMREALQDMGHEVDLRRPYVEEDFSEYDHIFGGIGPLQGMGTSYAYGGLAAIIHGMNAGKLTIYIDDPNIDKVMTELRRNVQDPTRMMKPFFSYKHEHEVATQPHIKEWLAAGVAALIDNAWPRLLVPAHSWSVEPEAMYGKKCPQASGRILGIDPSAYLPDFPNELGSESVRENVWVSEDKITDRWLMKKPLQYDVRHFVRGELGRVNDNRLLLEYRKALGVIQAPIKPVGWWASRIGYAAMSETIYCTQWQNTKPIGPSYSVLPDHIEYMQWPERMELARAQKKELAAVTPSRDDVKDQLNSILKVEATA